MPPCRRPHVPPPQLAPGPLTHVPLACGPCCSPKAAALAPRATWQLTHTAPPPLLQDLNLSANNSLALADLAALAAAPNLSRLSLRFVLLHGGGGLPPAVAGLRHLTHLDVSYCGVIG